MSAPADPRSASAPPPVATGMGQPGTTGPASIGQATAPEAQQGASAARQRAAIYLLAPADPEAAKAARTKLDAYRRDRGYAHVACYSEKPEHADRPVNDRPALCRLAARVRAQGFEVVIVQRYSDLGNDWRALALVVVTLAKHGVRVESARGEPPLDPTTLRQMLRDEQRRVRRNKQTLKAKRSRGEVTGGHPRFGFRVAADGVHVESDPVEQSIIGQVKQLAAQGLHATAIARRLSDAGARTRTGSRFTHKQVQRILARV